MNFFNAVSPFQVTNEMVSFDPFETKTLISYICLYFVFSILFPEDSFLVLVFYAFAAPFIVAAGISLIKNNEFVLKIQNLTAKFTPKK